MGFLFATSLALRKSAMGVGPPHSIIILPWTILVRSGRRFSHSLVTVLSIATCSLEIRLVGDRRRRLLSRCESGAVGGIALAPILSAHFKIAISSDANASSQSDRACHIECGDDANWDFGGSTVIRAQ